MFRKLHPPASPVTVTVDGVAVSAEAGESVAAVLLRTPPFHARIHLVSGEPVAPYCMMGMCQECLAVVDGAGSTQTCRTPVRDGMVIRRPTGPREIADG